MVNNYFLDSSALIKRYADEPGKEWVRELVRPSAGNTIFVASIIRVEVFSGASRRKREGEITERTLQTIRLVLKRHFDRQYNVVDFTDLVNELAQNLLAKHPLRAMDAIQLASALIANQQLTESQSTAITFISADKRLAHTAVVEGLAVDDPNVHLAT